MQHLLPKSNHAEPVGASVPVYLAAVLEHLAAEVLERAGNAARENKKTQINKISRVNFAKGSLNQVRITVSVSVV
ncbi:unnamed protein product [Echinostoma caproni]|uniref:Histone H2A n=1 Tax=Echinostoma caproni TaxID=27848 RepID=A0A183AEA8_9TREM|nr:unnamed protein product [Echinostoma caproni]